MLVWVVWLLQVHQEQMQSGIENWYNGTLPYDYSLIQPPSYYDHIFGPKENVSN